MRATKGNLDTPSQQMSREIDLLRDRFSYVHQAHEVDPSSLAEMLKGHGFTLSALRDASQLDNLLTPAVIEETAARFHIREEWLRGSGPSNFVAGCWYKMPQKLCNRLLELAREGQRPELVCIRRERADFESAFDRGDEVGEEPMGFVLVSQPHAKESARPFLTYELWEFQRWNYPNCRLYFKAIIRWLVAAESRRVASWRGVELPPDVLRALQAGDLLPVAALQARRSGCVWYPDDYIDTPEKSARAKEESELELVEKLYRDCKLHLLQP